jgi:hypothetical protein
MVTWIEAWDSLNAAQRQAQEVKLDLCRRYGEVTAAQLALV